MEVLARHETVLLKEAVQALALTPGASVIDATGGAGGHSAQILRELKHCGRMLVMDSDPLMVEKLRERLLPKDEPKAEKLSVHIVCENFRNIARVATELECAPVDAVLADLGWNSEQFESEGKGFSFQKDEPLQMTYGDLATAPFTAMDVVNTWSEDALADALFAYADERFARKIAEKIVLARKDKKIETTTELVAAVTAAIPKRFQHGRTHPATKTFQALRIAVNDELEALADFIRGAVSVLNTEGKLVIITFHSIEDRIVKQAFRTLEKEQQGTILTKKPLCATAEEIQKNPRARSAKLRIFQKT